MNFTGLELFSPDVFNHMKEVAGTIFQSGRCNKPWLTNPQSILFAMQKGYDLGIPPLTALDHICQFRDKGTWACSIFLAKGLVASKGGTVQVISETDLEVKVLATRPAWKDHSETVTMAEIVKAGISTGKDTWTKYPKAMLRATAIRRALTHMWADVLVGVTPIDMELEQETPAEPDDIQTVTADEAKPRKARASKKNEEVVVPEKIAIPHVAEEQVVAEPDNVVAEPDKAEEAPVVEAPLADDPVIDVPIFDYSVQAHRMLLIAAIKNVGLTPAQIKLCKPLWEAGWAKDHGVKAEVFAIAAGLMRCALEGEKNAPESK